MAESNCLSRESAEGFRSLEVPRTSKITLLCGASSLGASAALRLYEQAAAGTWVIWEISPFAGRTQARVLRDVFSIAVGEAMPLSPDRLYVRYRWPCAAITRSFCAAMPVRCSQAEVVAFYGDTPVAMRRAIGRGGLVVLGSMLGPSLRAEDREARAIAREMLQVLA